MRKKLLSFALAILMMFLFASCSRETLENGNTNDTDTSMEMSYDKFTGIRTRTITLTADAVITVDIVTNDGRLDLSVADGSGNQPYTGKKLSTNHFTFKVSEDGEYTIKIVGNSHNGSYIVSW